MRTIYIPPGYTNDLDMDIKFSETYDLCIFRNKGTEMCDTCAPMCQDCIFHSLLAKEWIASPEEYEVKLWKK